MRRWHHLILLPRDWIQGRPPCPHLVQQQLSPHPPLWLLSRSAQAAEGTFCHSVLLHYICNWFICWLWSRTTENVSCEIFACTLISVCNWPLYFTWMLNLNTDRMWLTWGPKENKNKTLLMLWCHSRCAVWFVSSSHSCSLSLSDYTMLLK